MKHKQINNIIGIKCLISIIILFFQASSLFAQDKLTSDSSLTSIDTTKTNIKAVALAVFPGVIWHGLGHRVAGEEETAHKLLKLEGISFLTGVTGLTALSFLGNANETAGILIPVSMIGFGTFAISWFADVMGTTGLSRSLESGRPYQQTYLRLSYIDQDNNQSPYYRFFSGRLQYGTEKFFIQANAEFEESADYQEYILKGGYNISQKKYMDLYVIPETKYKYSTEGFSISQADLQVQMDLNLASISNTLENIYFVNTLGYGTEWYRFNNNGIDFSNGLMIISQGLRFHLKNIAELSTKYERRSDELIGGSGVLITVLKHSVRLKYKKYYTEFQFTHGQGYRSTINMGVGL